MIKSIFSNSGVATGRDGFSHRKFVCPHKKSSFAKKRTSARGKVEPLWLRPVVKVLFAVPVTTETRQETGPVNGHLDSDEFSLPVGYLMFPA